MTEQLIDPTDITDYTMDDGALERFALFSVLVAGKTAKVVARQLQTILWYLGEHADAGRESSPFERFRVRTVEEVHDVLYNVGVGCHHMKARGCHELASAGLDLRTCSPEELEKIHGIGRKTSRFFILHSRRDAQVAALDTHILKWLRENGHEGAPKLTPSSAKSYRRWEEIFLSLVPEGKDVAEFDLEIWRSYAR